MKDIIYLFVVVGMVISTSYIRSFVGDCLKIAKELKEDSNDDKSETTDLHKN